MKKWPIFVMKLIRMSKKYKKKGISERIGQAKGGYWKIK